MDTSRLAANYRSIQERIHRACETSRRDPADVVLIAVSKLHTVGEIEAIYQLGHRDFGESRLQEAELKIQSLPKEIRWHFIGALQSNKAKRIAENFQAIHSIDSASQIKEIAKAARPVEVLIEVNLAREEQKSGIFTEKLDEFHQMVIHCPNALFRGLMTIGPATDDPESMRPIFRELREWNERLGGQWLSMGMSADFDVAIQEGATHVRVGTAIFGSR